MRGPFRDHLQQVLYEVIKWVALGARGWDSLKANSAPLAWMALLIFAQRPSLRLSFRVVS